MRTRSRRLASRGLAFGLGFLLLVTAGCSLEPNLIGGREKCWPEDGGSTRRKATSSR